MCSCIQFSSSPVVHEPTFPVYSSRHKNICQCINFGLVYNGCVTASHLLCSWRVLKACVHICSNIWALRRLLIALFSFPVIELVTFRMTYFAAFIGSICVHLSLFSFLLFFSFHGYLEYVLLCSFLFFRYWVGCFSNDLLFSFHWVNMHSSLHFLFLSFLPFSWFCVCYLEYFFFLFSLFPVLGWLLFDWLTLQLSLGSFAFNFRFSVPLFSSLFIVLHLLLGICFTLLCRFLWSSTFFWLNISLIPLFWVFWACLELLLMFYSSLLFTKSTIVCFFII